MPSSSNQPKLTPSRKDIATERVTAWHLHSPERGIQNLRILKETLGEQQTCALFQKFDQIFPKCPDADMGLNNLERFLAGPRGRKQLPALMESDADTLETLVQLLSSSQFLTDVLLTNPEFVSMLSLPLRESPSKNDLMAELMSDAETAYGDAELMKVFSKFRRKQFVRIGTNDLARMRSLEEITHDISLVADSALEVALQLAQKQVSERFGVPHLANGQPARCVILAFGKHGGQELNYSSDIDLMFVYDEEGRTSGSQIQQIDNGEYFARVVSKLVRLLTTHNEFGQAYRVDLRLRPEGERGPLARSLASTLSYYDTLGRTWERQALIKARPAAGDMELGNAFLNQIAPFIWRKYLSLAEINEIKALKRRIEDRTRHKGEDLTDVKTGFGGIRDAEFTIQFLQLLNGGDMPQIRQTNTLKAIHALEEVGCLTHQEARILDQTYHFLRETEHKIQLMFDLQTHRLPEKESELSRLALGMGYGKSINRTGKDFRAVAVEEFWQDYRKKTELNRRILDHALHEAFSDGETEAEPETDLILDPVPDRATIERVLGKYPFKDSQLAYQNLMELAKENVPFLSTRRCRHFLASIAPSLLKALAETPDPDMALVNLEKVSASLGGKGVLWELFSFSPPALHLYVELCAWSQFLSDILINNPGMIDDLLDSLLLNQPRTQQELREELTDLCRHAEDPDLILHSFQDKEILRAGVRDILRKDSLKETTAALSDVAETILAQIADLQLPAMMHRFGVPYLSEGPRKGEPARFVILGLGKLGGREMGYHSDLDLIVIYEGDGRTGPPPGASRFDRYESTQHLHYFTELAQRIIKATSQLGPNGRLYQVDMRLRPTGKSGSLVIPLAEFERYYGSSQAQLWERQALTRARVVYGEESFGRKVKAAVEKAAYQHPWKPEMAAEIAAMRERVQASGSARDVKRGYGGIIDVEFLIQLFRLKHGAEEESLRTTNSWDALSACRDEGLVSDEEHQTLWSSYVFLRLVESRLRIVHNRSLDELPDNDDDLEKLARRLGFEGDDATQRFMEELDQCLRQTREIFLRIVERERSGGAT